MTTFRRLIALLVLFPVAAFAAGPSAVLGGCSSSTQGAKYNAYRGSVMGGPYQKLNATPLPSCSYTDSTVQYGTRYFYVMTAVNSFGESGYSNEVAGTPKATTTTQISSSPTSPWTFGTTATFTVVVLTAGPVPTGNITFTDFFGGNKTVIGIIPLNSTGKAFLTTSSLAIGVHTIVARFDGDGANSGSQGSITVNVKTNAPDKPIGLGLMWVIP